MLSDNGLDKLDFNFKYNANVIANEAKYIKLISKQGEEETYKLMPFKVNVVLNGKVFNKEVTGILDLLKMVGLKNLNTSFDLFSCTCGYAECNGFSEKIKQTEQEDTITWTVDKESYPMLEKETFIFDKQEYLNNIKQLKDFLKREVDFSAVDGEHIIGYAGEDLPYLFDKTYYHDLDLDLIVENLQIFENESLKMLSLSDCAGRVVDKLYKEENLFNLDNVKKEIFNEFKQQLENTQGISEDQIVRVMENVANMFESNVDENGKYLWKSTTTLEDENVIEDQKINGSYLIIYDVDSETFTELKNKIEVQLKRKIDLKENVDYLVEYENKQQLIKDFVKENETEETLNSKDEYALKVEFKNPLFEQFLKEGKLKWSFDKEKSGTTVRKYYSYEGILDFFLNNESEEELKQKIPTIFSKIKKDESDEFDLTKIFIEELEKESKIPVEDLSYSVMDNINFRNLVLVQPSYLDEIKQEGKDLFEIFSNLEKLFKNKNEQFKDDEVFGSLETLKVGNMKIKAYKLEKDSNQ